MLEIKTDDSLFLGKNRDNFIVCLFVEFWRFLHFRSEHRLGARLATSIKGRLEVGVVILLPGLREVDMLQLHFNIKYPSGDLLKKCFEKFTY